MLNNLFLALVFLLATPAASVAGEKYVIDRNHSDVAFQVRHVTGPVRGVFSEFGGTIDYDATSPAKSSVEFRIKATSVDTQNQKRDAHLRSADFFDVGTHPEIVFTSTTIVPKDGSTFDVRGRLTIRGVTREIVLPVRLLREAGDSPTLRFETASVLNRKDYQIIWNRALDTGGWVLADEVQVSITLQAVRQAGDGTNQP